MTATRVRIDGEVIVLRCTANVYWLRSECVPIARRLRSDFAVIAKRLHIICAAIDCVMNVH
jgi:hypothetical protein